jgi:Zn-dependent peptidase ImmA (M78 family)
MKRDFQKDNISTVEKGNRFEKRSLEIIKRALDEGSLGIKDYIKIFEKPSYYSDDRKGNITFDLSIEVWPPNSKRFVLVYLIECKDYSKPIPVNDIEEFYNKVLQVAEGCAKPVFIANNAFQQGAFNYAESKRMMLIRAEEGTDHQIILHKKSGSPGEFELNYLSNIHDLKGAELLCKNIDKALETAFKDATVPKILELSHNLDYLTKQEIEVQTEIILKKINPNVFKDGSPLFLSVIENYIKSLGIELVTMPRSSEYLGHTDLYNKKISINSAIINTQAHLFVLSHELGHFILHQGLVIDQKDYDDFPDPILSFKTFKYVQFNPENCDFSNIKHWIEWQANYFAESLVLPWFALKAKLWFYQDELGMSRGKLYLTNHDVNNDNTNKIIRKLSRYYNVTPTAVIFRLKELDLFEEYTNVKSIGEIILEYTDSFV